MPADRMPTRAQAEVIRYFDGGPPPEARTTSQTYEVCRNAGWIEPVEQSPFYHRTTAAGRQALERYDNPVPSRRGRPRKTDTRVSVWTLVDKTVADQIDAARGGLPRPEWLRQAIRNALAATTGEKVA